MSDYSQIEKIDHIKGDWWLWLAKRNSDGKRGSIQADGGFNLVAEETFEPDEE